MYERAARNLLHLNKDQLNPNLGPGTYNAAGAFNGPVPNTIDSILGKPQKRQDAYAPFNSLESRKNAFEEQSHGKFVVSPQAYNPKIDYVSNSTNQTSAVFSKSQVPRFKTTLTELPAPNNYELPSTLNVKPNAKAVYENAHRNAKVKSRKELTALTRTALAAEVQPCEQIAAGKAAEFIKNEIQMNGVPLIDSSDLTGCTEEERLRASLQSQSGNDYIVDLAQPNIIGRYKNSKLLLPPNSAVASAAKDNVLVPSRRPKSAASAHKHLRQSSSKIVWRRKMQPPSIPSGAGMAGYKEDANGSIRAIRAEVKSDSALSPFHIQVSSVANAKHAKKGFTFGHGSCSSTLCDRRAAESMPSPGQYDTISAFNSHVFPSTAVSIGTAKCVRITDDVINAAKREAVPGPGTYVAPSEFEKAVKEVPNPRPQSGAANRQTSYIPRTLLENPGPGAYSTPTSSRAKDLIPGKSFAFASTSARFDSQAEKLARTIPPPGSYYSDDNSLKAPVATWKQPGLLEERLGRLQLINKDNEYRPSPAEYQEIEVARVSEEPKKQRYIQPVSQNTEVLQEKLHKKVFGTSANRFGLESNVEVPSPVQYNTESASKTLWEAGKVPIASAFRSTVPKSVCFENSDGMPGPAEYTLKQQRTSFMNMERSEPFLVAERRFRQPKSDIIASDVFYINGDDCSLIRKTFNVTIN